MDTNVKHTLLLCNMILPQMAERRSGSVIIVSSIGGLNSPLKKASLTGFHATAKHIAAKAVSPSSETMRTI